MKLSLNAKVRSELFEIQKILIKSVSLAAAAIIFLVGALIQLLHPADTIGLTHRLIFISLFGLTAFVATRKQLSYRLIESLLAASGALFLARMLVQYYNSGLSPMPLTVILLASVGLSGVFIRKTSLIIINAPSFIFLFHSIAHPPSNPIIPNTTSLIFLTCAAVVGYFLTWQKVYLINKSLALEVHKNTVINNLQEGVLLIDAESKVLTLNQAICQITGLTVDEIANRATFAENWKPFESDGITPLSIQKYPSFVALKTGQTVKDYPMVIKTSGPKLSYLEVTASPIMSQTEPRKVEFVLVTTRDVSELKKAQEVIEHQKLQTLANSKLTALGEMAAGIAHEINNPLTIILGRVDHMQKLVSSGRSSTLELTQSLEKISKTTLRISKIVKSMKSLSRESESDDFAETNIKAVLDDIVTVSNDHFRKNEIELTLNIDPNLVIECNSGLVSQVFMNLMSNSIDAIKNQSGDRWIHLDAFTQGAVVTISFSDSGPGIPAHIQEKIMLPFFTTKEAGKGTGVGLSLCRTIISNHKGNFYILKDAPTTTFRIELPLKQPQAHLHKTG